MGCGSASKNKGQIFPIIKINNIPLPKSSSYSKDSRIVHIDSNSVQIDLFDEDDLVGLDYLKSIKSTENNISAKGDCEVMTNATPALSKSNSGALKSRDIGTFIGRSPAFSTHKRTRSSYQ
eukprot:TRINITY_DN1631_c0_g5_i1.p1 TRINITY_DN1631_c0_g5~~TRINITY_DN1631_c0_g5_i1.p1  ORF type:complete len:121 (+),score=14.41 TRINITY_DN1631_c0_g5_i1:113-475(+)